jgi:Leucine-rich repeat (LRR) protein
MRGNFVYLFLSALLTLVVEQSAFAADRQVTLHFPSVSVGKLTLYQDSVNLKHSTPFGVAMGNLSVAREARLGLKINYAGSLDLSFLGKIGAPNLVALDLGKTPVEEKQFVHLRSLTWLRRLDAQDTDLSDATMESIAKLNSLEHLDISRTLVTAKGFRAVSHLSNLVDLYANSIKLDDDCIASLAGLSKIRSLLLGATCISDKGLLHLARLKTLNCLHVARTPVTDKGVAQVLSACKGIEELDLADTNISVSLLPSLKNLPNLHTLILRYRDFKPTELLAIRKALPRCKIDENQPHIPLEFFAPLH